MVSVAILTISDSRYSGSNQDVSGDMVSKNIKPHGFQEVYRGIVPDNQEEIRSKLIQLSDDEKINVILTTGGTGLGPRDCTPEATKKILDLEVPGISEAMRIETRKNADTSILSRGISGLRGDCLIVNLPGSPKAVSECLNSVISVIGHAVEMLSGRTEHQ